MNGWQAYIQGLKTVFRFPKIWLLYYMCNIGLALLVAYPVFTYLKRHFSQSHISEALLQHYDFYILTDVLSQYGQGIRGLLQQSLGVGLVYLVVSVFLMGGILHHFLFKKSYKKSTFWAKNAYFFGRILSVTVLFFVFQMVLLLLAWVVFYTLAKGMSPDHIQSEQLIVNVLCLVGTPYLLFVCMLRTLQDYTKATLVAHDFSVWKALQTAVAFCKRHLGSVLFLLVAHTLVAVACFWIYKTVDSHLKIESMKAVILFFLFSQMYIFLRIGLKLWTLASLSRLYQQASATFPPAPTA